MGLIVDSEIMIVMYMLALPTNTGFLNLVNETESSLECEARLWSSQQVYSLGFNLY